MDRETAFVELQRRALPTAWAADQRGSGIPHTIVALPSLSLDRSVYEHYGDRVPPLENRYLHCILMARDPAVRIVFLSSLPVPSQVVDAYLRLVPAGDRDAVRSRLAFVTPDDRSARPLAVKLLERPDLLDEVRRLASAGGPALLEAWNVTEPERDLALALDIPVFGTAPSLRGLATKSQGRRLMAAAGVPVPPGVEQVRDADGVAAAIEHLRSSCDVSGGVVVKHDDSVAGDGNIVLPGELLTNRGAALREAVAARLPDWYRTVLLAGGVVEQRVRGADFRSPSCQADITPSGSVVVLATHEQRLGGPDGQVYEGCTCPADPGYARTIGDYTLAAGRALAAAGAVGRYAVDFVVCRAADGGWDVYALEINLRKGGTTHTMGITRLLTGASYDVEAGRLLDGQGRSVHYAATDNLVDPAWKRRSADDVLRTLTAAGLAFDQVSRRGIAPHLLDCLAVDGRMGYTAIGDSAEQVADMERRLADALSR